MFIIKVSLSYLGTRGLPCIKIFKYDLYIHRCTVPVSKSTIQVAYNCAPELNSTGAGVIIIQ